MLIKQSVLMLCGLVCSAGLVLQSAQAADAKAGEAKAVACTGCHGPKGISFAPDVPNLAGQKEAYLAKAIKYYKTGERKNPMMAGMVGGLSDEDIANLAAYFSSLK